MSNLPPKRTTMVSKADFTPEEWVRIVASPLVVGMAITAADPSGPWGLLQEGIAGAQSLLDAKQNAMANPIAKAIAEDVANSEIRTAAKARMQSIFKGVQVGEIKTKSIEELRSVAAIVDAKAPEDAVGFKAWLTDVAKGAAQAGNEGGFLGFGGVAVSDAERATMAEISMALGTM